MLELETVNFSIINDVASLLQIGYSISILLCNLSWCHCFEPNKIKECIEKMKSYKNCGYLIEVSGGITLENVAQYFIEGFLFI